MVHNALSFVRAADTVRTSIESHEEMVQPILPGWLPVTTDRKKIIEFAEHIKNVIIFILPLSL
jgi:hypothetical protein